MYKSRFAETKTKKQKIEESIEILKNVKSNLLKFKEEEDKSEVINDAIEKVSDTLTDIISELGAGSDAVEILVDTAKELEFQADIAEDEEEIYAESDDSDDSDESDESDEEITEEDEDDSEEDEDDSEEDEEITEDDEEKPEEKKEESFKPYRPRFKS